MIRTSIPIFRHPLDFTVTFTFFHYFHRIGRVELPDQIEWYALEQAETDNQPWYWLVWEWFEKLEEGGEGQVEEEQCVDGPANNADWVDIIWLTPGIEEPGVGAAEGHQNIQTTILLINVIILVIILSCQHN